MVKSTAFIRTEIRTLKRPKLGFWVLILANSSKIKSFGIKINKGNLLSLSEISIFNRISYFWHMTVLRLYGLTCDKYCYITKCPYVVVI